MKVILLENIGKIGSIGEIIDVKEVMPEIILYLKKSTICFKEKYRRSG